MVTATEPTPNMNSSSEGTQYAKHRKLSKASVYYRLVAIVTNWCLGQCNDMKHQAVRLTLLSWLCVITVHSQPIRIEYLPQTIVKEWNDSQRSVHYQKLIWKSYTVCSGSGV